MSRIGVVEVYMDAFWFSITVYTHTLQIQYDNKCMIMYSLYAHRLGLNLENTHITISISHVDS